MKHTPTPWQLDNGPKSGLDLVIWDKDNQEPICTCWNRAGAEQVGNAEFIVRACNCHEELVEACKLAYSNLRAIGINLTTFNYVEEQLKEAIANATK